MNTSMLSLISSCNMAVIKRWKVAGVLHYPNGIRLYAKVPSGAFRGVNGLVLLSLEEDASSSKRFLPAMVKIYFDAGEGGSPKHLEFSLRSDGYAYPVFVRCLDRMGTPTQHCDYWSGWVRLPRINVRDVLILLAFACSLFGALVMSVIGMCKPNTKYNWGKIRIMPPKMRTRSAGRPATESLGGGTGVRVGRGGRGCRPREGNDERVDDLNGHGNNQGVGANRGIENQNGNVVNENVPENIRNVLVYGNRVGCSYKEFLSCNPKEYDGKGGAVVLTRWIKKIKNAQDMSGCSIDQKVKYTTGSFVEFCPSHEMQKLETELWNHVMVRAGHDVYTDKFHELARLVPHLVTPKSRKIERNRSIKKVEKKENAGEPSKDKNGRDDNKRTRTENVFATTVSPVGRDNTGTWPKSVPRNVNLVNARNPPVRACYKCGCTDHVRSSCPRWNRA
uniref:Reverse transcriptase domain-containing protein n=1 Tax=Tanacetum cinerariifolium TaxID=118510 RepID=A0A6L2KDD9_TANCI|nr:reverse transcriptase domain-containing protein [Tanacetum cinerariifolium]